MTTGSPATYPQQTQGGEPPLDQPYYGAPFGVAAKRFFQKYATFSGRASRSEYWWWALVVFIVSAVLNIASLAAGGAAAAMTGETSLTPGATVVSAIAVIWTLATIIPTLALAWRRLHDTNRSGAWYLLILIPIVGAIILLVFFVSASDPAGRRFDR
jgi:uncharacterized membrane protein YhaH (DUF805 family)